MFRKSVEDNSVLDEIKLHIWLLMSNSRCQATLSVAYRLKYPTNFPKFSIDFFCSSVIVLFVAACRQRLCISRGLSKIKKCPPYQRHGLYILLPAVGPNCNLFGYILYYFFCQPISCRKEPHVLLTLRIILPQPNFLD